MTGLLWARKLGVLWPRMTGLLLPRQVREQDQMLAALGRCQALEARNVELSQA